MLRRSIPLVIMVGLLLTCQSAAQTRLTRAIPWIGSGVWLKFDGHIHTKFTDGGYTVEQIAAKAESFLVDAIAITDHSDRDLRGATPEYFAEIAAARLAHPRLVILTGVEWNVPPFGGNEHATVLVPQAAENRLPEFKDRFDDLNRPSSSPALALDGLRWLATAATVNGVKPVVEYQHPSRRDAASLDNVADVVAWRTANDLVVGMAGAPGHQNHTPLGSYDKTVKLLDRWDPVTARIGDAWDALLARGLDVWGVGAPSDFHGDDPRILGDFWPGQFSETWVYAPDRSVDGVLRALRAGSFFGSHGLIVREVVLEVTAPGGTRPAQAGEELRVRAGTPVTVTVRYTVPPTAWAPGANAIDLVELIGVESSGSRSLVAERPRDTAPALSYQLSVPPGGIAIRARGFRTLDDGTRLAFYTNPVRVRTGG